MKTIDNPQQLKRAISEINRRLDSFFDVFGANTREYMAIKHIVLSNLMNVKDSVLKFPTGLVRINTSPESLSTINEAISQIENIYTAITADRRSKKPAMTVYQSAKGYMHGELGASSAKEFKKWSKEQKDLLRVRAVASAAASGVIEYDYEALGEVKDDVVRSNLVGYLKTQKGKSEAERNEIWNNFTERLRIILAKQGTTTLDELRELSKFDTEGTNMGDIMKEYF